jgi:hypothetical protein
MRQPFTRPSATSSSHAPHPKINMRTYSHTFGKGPETEELVSSQTSDSSSESKDLLSTPQPTLPLRASSAAFNPSDGLGGPLPVPLETGSLLSEATPRVSLLSLPPEVLLPMTTHLPYAAHLAFRLSHPYFYHSTLLDTNRLVVKRVEFLGWASDHGLLDPTKCGPKVRMRFDKDFLGNKAIARVVRQGWTKDGLAKGSGGRMPFDVLEWSNWSWMTITGKRHLFLLACFGVALGMVVLRFVAYVGP